MNLQGCENPSTIVPWTGLEQNLNVVILGVLVPILIGIVFAILGAKFGAPLYLKLKIHILAKSYKNGFISLDSSGLGKKKFVNRLIFSSLLTFGFMAAILNWIDPEIWLSEDRLCSMEDRGLNPLYHIDIFITLMGVIFPVSIGLWSISWILEDAGLLHYSLEKNTLYEVEPVHVKYGTLLQGYAGLSSILFIVNFTQDLLKSGYLSDGALIILALLIIFMCFIPVYFVYTKTMKNGSFLQKGLPELKELTENELIRE